VVPVCPLFVWIDREIDLGKDWEDTVRRELNAAEVVVVLWKAEARRSEWVRREAQVALESGRLLQMHTTELLPLPEPFDKFQAVRTQPRSGESGHSERVKLLGEVAERLASVFHEVR
jgi:adenylate cyclase